MKTYKEFKQGAGINESLGSDLRRHKGMISYHESVAKTHGNQMRRSQNTSTQDAYNTAKIAHLKAMRAHELAMRALTTGRPYAKSMADDANELTISAQRSSEHAQHIDAP